MRYVISAMLGVAGLIHLLPLSGVLGAERLAALYGLSFDEPNLAILMRHRAVLFGLVGSFMLLAAFKPMLQSIALVGGIISVASFLMLAAAAGSYNAQIERVFLVDVVVLVCLVVGAIAHAFMLRKG
ncbi:MAG: phosphopantetheine adenylyltransferase [Telluria sp.]